MRKDWTETKARQGSTALGLRWSLWRITIQPPYCMIGEGRQPPVDGKHHAPLHHLTSRGRPVRGPNASLATPVRIDRSRSSSNRRGPAFRRCHVVRRPLADVVANCARAGRCAGSEAVGATFGLMLKTPSERRSRHCQTRSTPGLRAPRRRQHSTTASVRPVDRTLVGSGFAAECSWTEARVIEGATAERLQKSCRKANSAGHGRLQERKKENCRRKQKHFSLLFVAVSRSFRLRFSRCFPCLSVFRVLLFAVCSLKFAVVELNARLVAQQAGTRP